MGLLTQTNNTDSGRLTLNNTANTAAINICEGRGTKAINKPINTAIEALRLLRCQMLGSCNQSPKNRSD